MKSSLSAVRSVRGGGARVMHQVVMVVGLLRGTPPFGHSVGHGGCGLLELRPVTSEAYFIVHDTVAAYVGEVRWRLVMVRGRGRSLVWFLIVWVEVFIVKAF